MIKRKLAFYEGRLVQHVDLSVTLEAQQSATYRSITGQREPAPEDLIDAALEERIRAFLGRAKGDMLNMMLALMRHFLPDEHRYLRSCNPVAVIGASLDRITRARDGALDTGCILVVQDVLRVEFLASLAGEVPEANHGTLHTVRCTPPTARYTMLEGQYPRASIDPLPFYLIHAAGGGPKGFILRERVEPLELLGRLEPGVSQQEAAFALLVFAINCNQREQIANALAGFDSADTLFMEAKVRRPFLSLSTPDEEAATNPPRIEVNFEFTDRPSPTNYAFASPLVTEASVARIVSPESIRRLRVNRQAR